MERKVTLMVIDHRL